MAIPGRRSIRTMRLRSAHNYGTIEGTVVYKVLKERTNMIVHSIISCLFKFPLSPTHFDSKSRIFCLVEFRSSSSYKGSLYLSNCLYCQKFSYVVVCTLLVYFQFLCYLCWIHWMT